MTDLHYDLCIIGGGINGAGIARDAAGRGLSVLLVEAQDLASGTSSASTKLIHGGLRYLENYEFTMVRAALKEREILLRNAAHLIRPVEIVIPHDALQRPRWMIRLGLFLYDNIGGFQSVKRSYLVDISKDNFGKPLSDTYLKGFVYSDGWGDDSRLVVINAVDAAARDAKVLTYTTCAGLSVQNGEWKVSLQDTRTGEGLDIKASMVVNATGPWVQGFLETAGLSSEDQDLPRVRLVKGSHIIVPRQYDGDQLYLLQQPDKRVVFVIPYEGSYTLIGTTEEAYEGDPRDAMTSATETEYLCAALNAAFKYKITPSDVVFNYSGIRPLYDDGTANASKVTRDYKIHHHKNFEAPLLSIFGGKLTTYRVLAEEVVDKLMRLSGRKEKAWTSKIPLAGGDFTYGDFALFLEAQRTLYPWLAPKLLQRYARAYGTRMDYFLFDKVSYANLGEHFGDDVYEAEIRYLRDYEWAQSAEDIFWRRSKLGLHVRDKTVCNVEDYLLQASEEQVAQVY